jgi:hypothetical protein
MTYQGLTLGHEYEDISDPEVRETIVRQELDKRTNGHTSKIPLRHIACDGCVVNVGAVIQDGEVVSPGTPYPVHKDEWVKVMPVMSVLEVMALGKLQNSASDTSKIDEAFGDLCKELSLRVVQWNWTDMMGDELPQPFGRPDIIARLTTDEVVWLTNAMYEQAEERKNG